MDGYYDTQLLSRLKKSYNDRRNTFSWALMIWAATAVGFALFVPFPTTVFGSACVAASWSAIHFIRRM